MDCEIENSKFVIKECDDIILQNMLYVVWTVWLQYEFNTIYRF